MIRQFSILVAALFVLAGCASQEVWAPEEAITKASYSHAGPTSITLVTVINNHNGSGGHSALVINAHERVVYDPAGNFKHDLAPERNDVLYGMFPALLRGYYGFHARTAWHVITQEIEVSPEVAAIAYRAVHDQGASPKSLCANNISAVLNKVPGFTHFGSTFAPKRIMKEFAKLPGVKTDKIVEYDTEKNTVVYYNDES